MEKQVKGNREKQDWMITFSNTARIGNNYLFTRLESYNNTLPSTNQSTSLKSGLTLWSVCVL